MGRLLNPWPLLAVLLAGSAGAGGKDIRATDAAGPAQCAYADYQGSSAGRPAWPAANCLGGAANPYLRLHEADLAVRAAEVSAALARASEGQGAEVSRAGFEAATPTLLGSVESFYGGFDGGAKFPYLPALGALWRAHLRSGGPDLRQAVTLNLESMAQGGLYDHLGGGFPTS